MTQLDLPPPTVRPTPWAWARKNLFSNGYNVALTLLSGWLLGYGAYQLLGWAWGEAQWDVIGANLKLFAVGRYLLGQVWRLWLVLALVVGLLGLTLGSLKVRLGKRSRFVWAIALSSAVIGTFVSPWGWLTKAGLGSAIALGLLGWQIGLSRWGDRLRPWLGGLWGLSFPVVLWLIGGGLGLREVSSNLWNGLLLTVFTAVVSIVVSFPLGVLLALGRQSDLPVVRWMCILYIEIVRGLPLVGILFIAQVMLLLVLPQGIRLDRVLRAIAGLTFFSAAYLAENVRGGLQSIPRGQVEAARALGLNPAWVTLLIVLPQALRAVLPAIVGQFIGLFKDTSLLVIVGLLELTGTARSILAQPDFIGRYAEVYLFIGLIYWLFCYALSRASRRLEQHLQTGHQP